MSTAQREGGDDRAQEETSENEPERGQAKPDPGAASSLLELLLAQEAATPPPLASRVDGIVVGHIVSVEGEGSTHVTFPGAPEHGFAARSVVPLRREDQDAKVALMFECGDPRRPIVMGKLVSPLAAEQAEGVADGRRVEINAEQEIVLRCGESSITLTRAGKIIIRGAYVLSRSSGVNRIQGGSVEIN